MTGRSVHDALLHVLTSARLRTGLADGTTTDELGPVEADILRGADPERLGRLARFLGRHFYRERIVRLFAASRRLAREGGPDPLALVAEPAFDALLEAAEVGAAATADAIAARIERRLLEVLAGSPYGRDLVTYEGTLFRVEAGPRQWDGGPPRGEIPVRAPSTRLVVLDWDVTELVAAARRGEAVLPEPRRVPTSLLVALAPDGRLTTVRCGAPLQRLLDALDGRRTTGVVAARLGLEEAEVTGLFRQLTDLGAVVWS